LDSVLPKLPRQNDPNVMIGFETADDAGVYRLPADLAPDLALVQTVDFFTPIVDDPYIFGQIAAANSLSDIYAMGGRPLSALSIVGFPNTGRDLDVLEGILKGGLSKMQEAGCTVLGGHSIGDEEIKFGYAVTGIIRPGRVLANSTAAIGDRLILTKRLGTGIVATALKRGRVSHAAAEAAIESMRTLNRRTSEIALGLRVHAATDVTGFGLLGHAREMAAGSNKSLTIESSACDSLPEALDYAREGFLPGGLTRNREFLAGCVEFGPDVRPEVQDLLFDPQTSGGLLLAVHPSDALQLVNALAAEGVPARQVGEVLSKRHPLIRVM
jgi:selenide,water dikinase